MLCRLVEVLEDYVFERIGAYERPETVRLSELFRDRPSILLDSFMYGPDRDQPCTGCTHTVYGWGYAASSMPTSRSHLRRRQVADRADL